MGTPTSKKDDFTVKQTTESSYLWENNLLKGVDFKLKRSNRNSKLDSGQKSLLRSAKSVVQSHDPFEMQKEFLTPIVNHSISCILDKISDSEEGNCEEVESSDQETCAETVPNNSSCQLGQVGRVHRRL